MTHTSTEQKEALRLAEFFESMQKSSHRWYDGTPVHEKAAAELRRLHARVQELEAEKARLIEAYVPCPSATEAYMYGITQEKQG